MKRYVIRDKETKKVKYRNSKRMEFNRMNSAVSLYNDINWGLKYYYEIYDNKDKVIVHNPNNLRGDNNISKANKKIMKIDGEDYLYD